jgi:hypothetical protein
VFAPISAIFALLFFVSTLPNGIRLGELPADGDGVEIVAGYTLGDLAAFTSTAAARSLLFDVYAAGGHIDFINELDRTAVRIKAPVWAFPLLADRLPALFEQIPQSEPSDSLRSAEPSFRTIVEEEIRSALLGPTLPRIDYATGNAFILISASVPDSLRDRLAAIPKRDPVIQPDASVNRLVAERTFRFRAELASGAVIFASPVPGVFYRQWYSMLLLDRLIQRIVPLRLQTALPLTRGPYYYRLELAVPQGQFPEPAEENLLQELQRLQFTAARAPDLEAARQDAVAYLETKAVQEWFASHDLAARRDEGKAWIQAMSPDDMRVTARDLLITNRVLASWAPKPRQTTVLSEPLSSANPAAQDGQSSGITAGGSQRPTDGGRATLTQFPAHEDSETAVQLPEILSSGVSMVSSIENAVFISGGPMVRYDRPLTPEDFKRFQQFPANRILVLTPPASLDHARQFWSAFKGSANSSAGTPKSEVGVDDLPALFILKTILDLRVIEAGWWPDVSIRIDASVGAALQIDGRSDQREQILGWIKAIAGTPLEDAYFAWVREVAVHNFDRVLPDIQALTWERDRQGMIQGPATISLKHVQDVAQRYF